MNVTVKLTTRETFALSMSRVGDKARRTIFGTTGMGKKIYDQLIKQMTEEELQSLTKEWKSIKTNIPNQQPKIRANQDKLTEKISIPKVDKRTSPRTENTRVWRA